MKKIFLCILTFLIICSTGITAFAAETTPEETEFTIDISDLIEMKGKGYVHITVDTPFGFSGTVVMELEGSDGTVKTFQIRRTNDWLDGDWFKEGPCTVKNVYVYDTDMFLAEADVSSVNIDHDVDARIHVQVLENPDSPEWNATWTPPTADASQDTAPAPTTESTEAAEDATAETPAVSEETIPNAPAENKTTFPISLLLLSSLAVIVIVFCVKQGSKENEN